MTSALLRKAIYVSIDELIDRYVICVMKCVRTERAAGNMPDIGWTLKELVWQEDMESLPLRMLLWEGCFSMGDTAP